MEEKYVEVATEEEELDLVELKADDGKILKFYHIGTITHKERWFAFFQPAEEIDGVDADEVVIFEIVGDEGDEALAPIEDEALLDEVYAAFIAEMEADEVDDDCKCGDECHCGDDCDCDDDDCKCDEECHCEKCKN